MKSIQSTAKKSADQKPYFTIAVAAVLLFCSLQSNAQDAWEFAGDYKAIIGLYNEQQFVVAENADRDYKYTTDGGSTFQDFGISVSSPKFLVFVEYLNSNTMRAVVFTGSNYELYESTDGGANFTMLSTILPQGMFPFNQAPHMVSFDNSESLLSCRVIYNSQTISVLLRTTDGGSSWGLATADTFYFENLHDLEIYKDGHVVAARNTGTEVSTDRGQTFTPTVTSPPLNSSMELAYDGGQNIWAGGIIGSQNANAYYSSDGGTTWNPWSSVTDCDEVKYTNPSTLVIWGSDDTTAISTDGGATFSTVRFPDTKPAGSILRLRVGGDQKTYYSYDGNAKLWILPGDESVGVSILTNETKIKIYPNPAADYIRIDSYQGNVEIYNISGQLLKSTNVTSGEYIDVSDLPSGNLIIKSGNDAVKVLKK